MTEKHKYALNKIISSLPENLRETYKEIAEYAISLGYMPVIKGKNETYVDFVKSKIKRTILKIDINPNLLPRLAIKFYALDTYSGIFEKAIDERILYWKKLGYKTQCFGCGKCDGTHGYKITLPDGEKGFLCGFGVLSLPTLNVENISEVKEALRIQDEYWRLKDECRNY